MAKRQGRAPDRRRDRLRRRDLARRRPRGQLGEAHRRPVRHPRDHALCDRRAEDAHRRHGRLRARSRPRSTRRNCRSASPRWRARKRSRSPASAAAAIFPGPLFLGVAPVEIEWQQRHEVARRVRRERGAELQRPDARRRERTLRELLRALPVRLGRGPARGEIRHQGLADLALDRLRDRRDLDPARRRGDPARRDRRGAVHRHRRLGQRRVADPLLAALRALGQRTIRRAARRSRSRRTATAS